MSDRAGPDAFDPVLAALEELGGGPVLILDAKLRICAATPAAVALLGPVPMGITAPKLLCGDAPKRPVAEALVAGRPVSAAIPRPKKGGGEILVNVRAVPLVEGGEGGATPSGWALLLSEDRRDPGGPELFHGMWTSDPGMKRMFRIVEKVGASEATVLVRGETGSGKELVARAIHALSPRHKGPFRAINCAALPAPLLESELFGHVRGAFTGAVRDHPGHFALAHRGTIFLDEVAELPLELQPKLLRALETQTILPVGGREPVPVDVRIVAATHRPLRREVEAGRFRADLMYRLRVIPVFLPPLRARGDDVLLLAARILDERNAASERKVLSITPGARAALLAHDWPGNVRELRNVIEYAYVIGEGPAIVDADLPPELLGGEAAADGGDEVSVPAPVEHPSPEAARILRALERAGGSRERAARALGLSRVTLWRHMRALGLLTE